MGSERRGDVCMSDDKVYLQANNFTQIMSKKL